MPTPASTQQDPSPTGKAPGLVASASSRLLALDALRGFDMFWIVGAEDVVHALHKLSDSGPIRLLADQMDHKPWAGFAFYDLIFPMFVFMVGVSLVFSLGKLVEREGKFGAVKRLGRRALLMYILGLFYYGGFSTPIDHIRLLGVLQRIAIAYFFAGLAFCYLGNRGRATLLVSLLLGYWALMSFVPVPGFGSGDFAEGHNLANWIDKQYLPWRKWDGDHDPEGLLSTIPAIGTCLLGMFAGILIQGGKVTANRIPSYLAMAGVGLACAGWLWSIQFPVVKKLWTSSFVLVAGGYSCLFLATFYYLIEVRKWQKWAQPFVWIGMNPITIYMLHNMLDMQKLGARFVGGDIGVALGRGASLASTVVVMLLSILFCRFLYRRQIFLRL